MKIFKKILIANRGEIAIRINRSLKKMGINTVGIYSQDDLKSFHTRSVDEAFLLTGNGLSETYLDSEKIIKIAIESGAEAIHPGYGFLSENANFASACARAGINFIGPLPEVIALMGNKLAARETMEAAGVPLTRGVKGSIDDILEASGKVKFPLMLKAAAGGGGKAMRIVHNLDELIEAAPVVRREAMNYFGDDELYAEHFFDNARHIEIQVLADHFDNVLIVGERDCSVQRRYQKVLEESPSGFITAQTREKLFTTARNIVRKIGYTSAGTLEFLVDEDQQPYFLEMNTRIQVEHPVTEMVTGIDLIEQQVYIAAGNEMKLRQESLRFNGHALEARLYAEDPMKNFLPSPGTILEYYEPALPGVRIDSAVDGPCDIKPYYDPMISKVIAWGPDRSSSLQMLKQALLHSRVNGLTTNREFLIEILESPDFQNNDFSTTWLERKLPSLQEKWISRRNSIEDKHIFSAWLANLLYNSSRKEGSLWERTGYWRTQIRKNVVFRDRQVELRVRERNKRFFVFTFDNQEIRVEPKSISKHMLIFEENGEWISANISSGLDVEDIVVIDGYEFRLKPVDYLPLNPWLREEIPDNEEGPKVIRSPLHGRVVKMNVKKETNVKKGDVLFILDAMKIENKIISPYHGCVREVRIHEGDQVTINQTALIIDNCNIN